jgi:Uma2 family endonuclease
MNAKAHQAFPKAGTATDHLLADRRNTSSDTQFTASAAGRWHNLLVSNTAIGIGSRLHGHKCEIYIGGMGVKLGGIISFPDIAIVNGEPTFQDQKSDLLLNPTIVIEVVSVTTASSEKTKTLESYLELASIKELLILKQDEMRVEHYARQNQRQWLYRIYNERDDVVSLDSIGCKIALQDIYANIKLRQAEISSRSIN